MSNLIDNRRRGTVYEFLAQEIKDGFTLSIVSAYFTIYAFEALQKPLNEGEFPTPQQPENCHPPTDLTDELSYKALADQIGEPATRITSAN